MTPVVKTVFLLSHIYSSMPSDCSFSHHIDCSTAFAQLGPQCSDLDPKAKVNPVQRGTAVARGYCSISLSIIPRGPELLIPAIISFGVYHTCVGLRHTRRVGSRPGPKTGQAGPGPKFF